VVVKHAPLKRPQAVAVRARRKELLPRRVVDVGGRPLEIRQRAGDHPRQRLRQQRCLGPGHRLQLGHRGPRHEHAVGRPRRRDGRGRPAQRRRRRRRLHPGRRRTAGRCRRRAAGGAAHRACRHRRRRDGCGRPHLVRGRRWRSRRHVVGRRPNGRWQERPAQLRFQQAEQLGHWGRSRSTVLDNVIFSAAHSKSPENAMLAVRWLAIHSTTLATGRQGASASTPAKQPRTTASRSRRCVCCSSAANRASSAAVRRTVGAAAAGSASSPDSAATMSSSVSSARTSSRLSWPACVAAGGASAASQAATRSRSSPVLSSHVRPRSSVRYGTAAGVGPACGWVPAAATSAYTRVATVGGNRSSRAWWTGGTP